MGSISNVYINGAGKHIDALSLNRINPELICMKGLPMPPSSNKIYGNRSSGQSFYGRRCLKAYQAEMNLQPYKDRALFQKHLNAVREWKKRRIKVECHSIFYFHYDSLYYANGTFKKNDVTNYIKAFHDALVKILGVDDCIFWRTSEEKEVVDEGEREHVDVKIYPIVRV